MQAAWPRGEHDFRAFTPTETQPQVLRPHCRDGALGRRRRRAPFEITADSFLRHMVRTLVGTMVDAVDVAPLLEGRPRAEAGAAAPLLVGCTSTVVCLRSTDAVSRRPLRPRRHARRLRRGDPRLVPSTRPKRF
jgi:hypothetical protein